MSWIIAGFLGVKNGRTAQTEIKKMLELKEYFEIMPAFMCDYASTCKAH